MTSFIFRQKCGTTPRRSKSLSKLDSSKMTKSPTVPLSLKQWADPIYLTAHYKTEPCHKYNRTCADFSVCPYFHAKKERRRNFAVNRYTCQDCELVKVDGEWRDPTNCPLKDSCTKCHTRMEQQFHPEVYKKMQCKDLSTTGACPRGIFCAFAHNDNERQGHREPEWNFEWEKILPAGVLPQYNFTKRKSLTHGNVHVTTATIPFAAIPFSPPISIPEVVGKKLVASPTVNSEISPKKTETLIVNCPKPVPLQLSFAEVLSGHKEDTLINSSVQASKQGEEAKPVKAQEKLAIPSIPISPVSISPSGSATFADILSGAKSSSEALRSRLGKLFVLTKINSDAQASFTPLPVRESNASLPANCTPNVNDDTKLNSADKMATQHACTNQEQEVPDPLLSSKQIENAADKDIKSKTVENVTATNEPLEDCSNVVRKKRTLTEEYEDISDLELEEMSNKGFPRLSTQTQNEDDDVLSDFVELSDCSCPDNGLSSMQQEENDVFPSISQEIYAAVVQAAALKALHLKGYPSVEDKNCETDSSALTTRTTEASSEWKYQNSYLFNDVGPPPGFPIQNLTLSNESFLEFRSLEDYPNLYQVKENDFSKLAEMDIQNQKTYVFNALSTSASNPYCLQSVKDAVVLGSGDGYGTDKNRPKISTPPTAMDIIGRNTTGPIDVDEFNRHVLSLRLTSAFSTELAARVKPSSEETSTQTQPAQNVTNGTNEQQCSNYNRNSAAYYDFASQTGVHSIQQMNGSGYFNPHGCSTTTRRPVAKENSAGQQQQQQQPQRTQNRSSVNQSARILSGYELYRPAQQLHPTNMYYGHQPDYMLGRSPHQDASDILLDLSTQPYYPGPVGH